MMKVGMLLLIFSVSAFATEFTHIKLSPQFEQYLNTPKIKSNSFKGMNASVDKAQVEFEKKADEILLGPGAPATANAKGFTNPFPVDGEESPLYARIREHLEAAHQGIGAQEVHQIQMINRQFNLGTQNFSGFSWQKPFGVVSVWADRQVTQNLFGSNWLIQDTFTFEIEATTFLEKLVEAGMVVMDQVDIGAFAGLTFKRVYTYYHYADSYEAGLSADFSKLFLPFVRFNRFGMELMGNEEIMKKEDQWTAKAGGMIATPPVYGFSFSGGVLAEAAFRHGVSIQNNITENNASEKYRVGVVNKGSLNVGANVSVQLDFYKLIKLTLLNFDLVYEYGLSREYTLGLSQNQWELVKNDQEQSREFTFVLHGLGLIRNLEPYIVRLDESSSSSLEARGSILLLGTMKKSKTEQVRVIKDQIVKTFYKNYSQSVILVQNLISRLFSAAILKLFKLPFGVKNAAVYTRQINLEYEATHPQVTNPEIIRIESSEQFSFLITQSYEAAKTHRFIDFFYKKDVMDFIDNHTTLTKNFIDSIRKENLRGPMIVESNIRIEKAGFDYLTNRPISEVFGEIAEVCGSWRVQDWKNEERRNKMLKRIQIGGEFCTQRIGQLYLKFKSDHQDNSLKPSLALFKSFLTAYYKASRNIMDMVDLFGTENTFVNGRLQATTNLGTSFLTTFSSGQFRGLGVIDNFKRTTGSRLPASIINE